MAEFDFSQQPHRRLNMLTGDWVLVSPHRTTRPWRGQVEAPPAHTVPPYDPICYMCPGNTRASGVENPKYEQTFVFPNDFAALTADTPHATYDAGGLLHAQGESGVCRVLCFSPRHDLALSRLDVQAIRAVVDMWAEQRIELAARPDIGYVQIFENRGPMMGASNPHPHGQLWATGTVPDEVAKEQVRLSAHHDRTGADLLGDYLELELDLATRIVCDNTTFVALVPFWATWPFETIIIPRRRVATIDDLDGDECDGLADLLKRLLSRYDNLFAVPFPYSMGFHEAPADEATHPEWRWHAHIFPPLLRSATVRKFMVGYELLAMAQRDTTPEQAADQLRECADR